MKRLLAILALFPGSSALLLVPLRALWPELGDGGEVVHAWTYRPQCAPAFETRRLCVSGGKAWFDDDYEENDPLRKWRKR